MIRDPVGTAKVSSEVCYKTYVYDVGTDNGSFCILAVKSNVSLRRTQTDGSCDFNTYFTRVSENTEKISCVLVQRDLSQQNLSTLVMMETIASFRRLRKPRNFSHGPSRSYDLCFYMYYSYNNFC